MRNCKSGTYTNASEITELTLHKLHTTHCTHAHTTNPAYLLPLMLLFRVPRLLSPSFTRVTGLRATVSKKSALSTLSPSLSLRTMHVWEEVCRVSYIEDEHAFGCGVRQCGAISPNDIKYNMHFSKQAYMSIYKQENSNYTHPSSSPLLFTLPGKSPSLSLSTTTLWLSSVSLVVLLVLLVLRGRVVVVGTGSPRAVRVVRYNGRGLRAVKVGW